MAKDKSTNLAWLVAEKSGVASLTDGSVLYEPPSGYSPLLKNIGGSERFLPSFFLFQAGEKLDSIGFESCKPLIVAKF
jgi:hypothetical protein